MVDVKRGDKVRVTFEGVVKDVSVAGLFRQGALIQLEETGGTYPLIPSNAHVEILSRADSPENDPIETVRYYPGDRSVYVKMGPNHWRSPQYPEVEFSDGSVKFAVRTVRYPW